MDMSDTGTRNTVLVWIAAGTLGFLAVGFVVGLIILAVRLDGEIANQVATAFQNGLDLVVKALAGVFAVDKIAETIKSVKATSAASQAQIAQATQGANGETPDASVSSPAGASEVV